MSIQHFFIEHQPGARYERYEDQQGMVLVL